jgi:hypothetical protein
MTLYDAKLLFVLQLSATFTATIATNLGPTQPGRNQVSTKRLDTRKSTMCPIGP